MTKRARDRAIVLTETSLGTSQYLTSEGYLLCREVPIGRTGNYDYLNEELIDEDDPDEPLEGGPDGILHVERRSEDVFDDASVASFEGKDVTDDHPEDLITPEDYKTHTCGVVLHPRRGEGFLSSYLIADLLIKDAAAIAAVRAGKREVSPGYDAKYESLGPGRARQTMIRGNHVALVHRGRCGGTCAIGDEAMPNKKPTALDRLKAAFGSRDAKTFDEAVKELEDGTNDMEAGGTHIHMHLPTTSSDPALSADKKGKDAEGEEKEGKGEKKPPSLDERVGNLETGFKGMSDSMKEMSDSFKAMSGKDKKAKDAGEEDAGEEEEESEEKDEDEDKGTDDEDGAEEAEEDEGETEDAEMSEEEEGKQPEKKSADKKAGDKAAKKGKDSSPLKAAFKNALSGVEIIAPGLKLPTFDSKQPYQRTVDGLCLLRRRALAKLVTTDSGADLMRSIAGKPKLPDGLSCNEVRIVFNSAVAMTADAASKTGTLKRAKVGDEDKKKGANFASPTDFNAAMKERFAPKA